VDCTREERKELFVNIMGINIDMYSSGQRVKSNGDPVLKVYIPEKNQQEPTIDMNDYNLMRDK
jgi:hypothetical protein